MALKPPAGVFGASRSAKFGFGFGSRISEPDLGECSWVPLQGQSGEGSLGSTSKTAWGGVRDGGRDGEGRGGRWEGCLPVPRRMPQPVAAAEGQGASFERGFLNYFPPGEGTLFSPPGARPDLRGVPGAPGPKTGTPKPHPGLSLRSTSNSKPKPKLESETETEFCAFRGPPGEPEPAGVPGARPGDVGGEQTA